MSFSFNTVAVTAFLMFLLLCTAPVRAEATVVSAFTGGTMYVDSNLSESCSGTYSVSNRNCSGSDGYAYPTITEGVSALVPDTEMYIREGKYHESVVLPSTLQTSKSKPVSIEGYKNERPILTGAKSLDGWQQCTAEICENNSNWQNIYYTKIDAAVIDKVEKLILIENGDNLFLASYPDQENAYDEEVELFFPVDEDSYGRTDGFTSTHLKESDGYWNDVEMRFWTHTQNNHAIDERVKSYSNQNIYFTNPLSKGVGAGTLPDGFSFVNSMKSKVLDRKGEYVVSQAPDGNNQYTVYLWPRSTSQLDSIEYIGEKIGFRNVINYLTIAGIEITAYAGTDTRSGGIVAPFGGTYNSVTIKDVVFHNILGKGALVAYGIDNFLVKNTKVYNTLAATGALFAAGSSDVTFSDNEVYDLGGTGIRFYTVTDGKMLRNYVHGYTGTHGNAYTCYLDCNNVLIKDNISYAIKGGIHLTLKHSRNITIVNNIFDGNDESSALFNDYGLDMRGFVKLINNAFIRSTRNNAINISKNTGSTYVIKNNIFDGGSTKIDGVTIDASHNIWTGLSWNQAARYGWNLGEGEFVHENISDLFDKYIQDKHTLAKNSPAINAGTDISVHLPESLLGEDLREGIRGNERPSGGQFDIGPFESMSGTVDLPDTDSDGIPDVRDNCVSISNILQEDADGDGIGNVCDDTPDGDAEEDAVDEGSENTVDEVDSTEEEEVETEEVDDTAEQENEEEKEEQVKTIVTKSPSYKFTRSLRLGDKGEDVRQLQKFLNKKGFLVAKSAEGSLGNETTYFGPGTRNALIRYQNARRAQILTPVGESTGTGFFGQSTIKQIGLEDDAVVPGSTLTTAQRNAILEQIKVLVALVLELQASIGR